MATEPTLIQSVMRALDLLDLVGGADGPMPAKKLARTIGLPLGTTYNLLRTLVHQGYLLREADGYLLGDQAGRLAGPQGAAVHRSRVRQILHGVHTDLRAAAYWAEYIDGSIRVVDIVDSPQAPRTDLWVGMQDAAHATALGKAVLSALPADQRRAFLTDHPLVDLTPRTLTDLRRLESQLAGASGGVLDDEEYNLGTVCLAVPARLAGRPGAVAVSVPPARLPQLLGRVSVLTRAARLLELAHSA